MKEIVNKVKNEIELFLKNNEEHQNKQIDCILINQDTNETITIASDGEEETIIFTPYTKEYENGYTEVPDWDFNFDGYVFEDLEKDYQVGFMSDNMHYNIWQALVDLYPEDIENKNGVQVYLQFCADNGITKKYLDEKLKLDTVDVMKYFEGLALFETMEYKGYVIEADDVNFDNVKENLVNIYETKTDYAKKESIETISLNTIGLKQNIRYYIDENYIDKSVIDNEKILDVKYVGIDNWDRPVYKDKKGNLYKDTNLGQGVLALCTSCNNEFYGEPDVPIRDEIKINIVENFKKEKGDRADR